MELVSLFTHLLSKQNVVLFQKNNLNIETLEVFRQMYMDVFLPLISIIKSKRTNLVEAVRSDKMSSSSVKTTLMTEKCKPLNLFDFSIYLPIIHSTD